MDTGNKRRGRPRKDQHPGMEASTSQDPRAAGDSDREEYRSVEELNDTTKRAQTPPNKPENLEDMVRPILTKVGYL